MTVRELSRADLQDSDRVLFSEHTVVAVIPVTSDVQWATDCAWAVARAAARENRRVALIDLSLERPALDMAAASPSDEGIVDAFLYGASLSRVAKTQDQKGLYYIGVGSRAADPKEVWGSPRWERLAQGFAKEGAVLVAFLPPHALDRWSLEPDGIVVLSPSGFDPERVEFPAITRRLQADVPLIAVISNPASKPAATTTPPGEPEEPAEARSPDAPAPPSPPPSVGARRRRRPARAMAVSTPVRAVSASGNRRFVWGAVGAGVAVALAFAIWSGMGMPRPTGTAPDVAPVAAVPVAEDTVVSPSQVTESPLDLDPDPASDAAPPPIPTGDSLFYSVQVAAFNTTDRAVSHGLEIGSPSLPVAITPVTIPGRGVWYRVLLGTFPTSAAADAALRDLWQRGLVPAGDGTILRTPLALVVGVRPDLATARIAVDSMQRSDIPAYVVPSPNGVYLLVGAFQSSNQARAADSLLTQAGMTSTLAPRLGMIR